jgi:hypothetical protein
VFTEELFRDYVTYCSINELKAQSQGEFTQLAKQHLPGAEKTKIRKEFGWDPKKRKTLYTSPLAAFRYIIFEKSVFL